MSAELRGLFERGRKRGPQRNEPAKKKRKKGPKTSKDLHEDRATVQRKLGEKRQRVRVP